MHFVIKTTVYSPGGRCEKWWDGDKNEFGDTPSRYSDREEAKIAFRRASVAARQKKGYAVEVVVIK